MFITPRPVLAFSAALTAALPLAAEAKIVRTCDVTAEIAGPIAPKFIHDRMALLFETGYEINQDDELEGTDKALPGNSAYAAPLTDEDNVLALPMTTHCAGGFDDECLLSFGVPIYARDKSGNEWQLRNCRDE